MGGVHAMNTKRVAGLAIAAACAAAPSGVDSGGSQATAGRFVLTSAREGIHVDAWEITNATLKLPAAPAWSISKRTLHGGRQEGVDLVTIDNGTLKIEIVPTRGMGVLRVDRGDVRLGWDSPVKEVVHPAFVNLESRGGLGWLEGFNEWFVRCGLEFAGHPGRDTFVNNVGERAEMDLTLHGKIANIPASEVEVLVDPTPPHRLRVRGRVDERMFYGPKLELWTEISTEPGAGSLRIQDRITNLGAYEQEFQIIYHSNYGPPLLGAGAEFVGAVSRVVPFNRRAADGNARWAAYGGPTPGFVEQVYCLYPYGDRENRSRIMLRNAAGDRGVSLGFSVAQLPYVTLWKNLTAIDEGYVTGLEPGTGFPYNRGIERQFGRVPTLAAGASREFAIEVGVHVDGAEVGSVADAIRRMQAGRPTTIDPAPVTLPPPR
jgi:Domain of unknown function (DUF4432)